MFAMPKQTQGDFFLRSLFHNRDLVNGPVCTLRLNGRSTTQENTDTDTDGPVDLESLRIEG